MPKKRTDPAALQRGKELIDLDRVGMTYEAASGPVEALADISLTVGAGEFVSLVGPERLRQVHPAAHRRRACGPPRAAR